MNTNPDRFVVGAHWEGDEELKKKLGEPKDGKWDIHMPLDVHTLQKLFKDYPLRIVAPGETFEDESWGWRVSLSPVFWGVYVYNWIEEYGEEPWD